LLREEQGIAASVLAALDVGVAEVRAQVARIVGPGDDATARQIPFTPRAKRVLELALREALSLGSNYIGTEHLLLGLVREGEGVAVQMLEDLGADRNRIRDEVVRALGGHSTYTYTPPKRRRRVASFVLGWALGVVSLAAGILIGWAIWG
jgi:ATP-dependent Clp protease ATP-binding subunit ClpC